MTRGEFEAPATNPISSPRTQQVLLGLVVVALIVVVTLAVLGRQSGGTASGAAQGPAGDSSLQAGPPPTEPVRLPSRGTFVDARVQPDGTVDVTQWLRGGNAISSVTLSVFDSPQIDVPGADPAATDLQVRTSQGTVVLADPTVGSEPRTIDLVRPSLLVQLDYTLTGVTEEQSSPPGRALIGTVFAGSDFEGDQGRARIQIGGRRIMSLACTAPGGELALRPCGGPREGGWSVNLQGSNLDDTVTAQVDLNRRAEANPDRQSGPTS